MTLKYKAGDFIELSSGFTGIILEARNIKSISGEMLPHPSQILEIMAQDGQIVRILDKQIISVLKSSKNNY